MNILITGGTGFIGTALCQSLAQAGHSMICLSRQAQVETNQVRFINSLDKLHSAEKIDAMINLAGSPIGKRWNNEYKENLINSRINTTLDLIRLIARLESRPKVLISASAIGYYGCQDAQKLDETADVNEEFTHQLCNKWEQAASKAIEFDVRTCIVRLGVVLGKNGGALSQMLPAFKFGLGGKIGLGSQYFSWVHRDDVIQAMEFLLQNEHAHGVYNLTSPNPVTNAQFSQALAKTLSRPCVFTTPSFAIKLMFGEMGETLLLNGQRVIPKRLQEAGYKFKYAEIEDALQHSV